MTRLESNIAIHRFPSVLPLVSMVSMIWMEGNRGGLGEAVLNDHPIRFTERVSSINEQAFIGDVAALKVKVECVHDHGD